MAARNDTQVHPQCEFAAIARTELRDHTRGDEPLEGTLDQMTLPILRDILTSHTSTPNACWCALWDGYGHQPSAWRQSPTFHLPGRDYWLFAEPLARVVELSLDFEHAGIAEAAAGGRLAMTSLTDSDAGGDVIDQTRLAARLRASGAVQSPNLWWPADRRWFVASEIDLDSTIVAGGADLVAGLLDTATLEVVEVHPDTSLLDGSDWLNRPER
ncbi:hypothetical protein ACFFOS_27840 [Nocardioides kongjuensis]|uniref:Uncharacterized protein n=1 Tax=Nocardioides kongjuensis TaxID=349522 RepID=A0A852RHA7_9ACTN|nr:hypothetical protein [Nocardioides kongjuensis]NYD32767.1 hypothetical protein [Nocardioides kongjuensis]